MAPDLDLSGLRLRLSRPVYRYHQYQGYTNDCGPTSVAIAVNAIRGQRVLDARAVAEEMNRVGLRWRPFPHLAVPRIPNWATFPWGIVHYLRREGLSARWHTLGTLETLSHNLQADRLTMVVTGEPWRWDARSYAGWAHVKILFGQIPGRGLFFVDPGYPRSPRPDRVEHHGLFWQAESEFMREWRTMLRIYIEVEDEG